MGQEENKQTIWDLWKHFVEQKKGVCIQQSQNKKAHFWKQSTVEFRGRAGETPQSSSAFNVRIRAVWKRHMRQGKLMQLKLDTFWESTEHQEWNGHPVSF